MATRLSAIGILDEGEGVYAYARISPDGTKLAYTSEHPAEPHKPSERIVTIRSVSDNRTLFAEPGVDAYWSPDGHRVIFRSTDVRRGVSILNVDSGRIERRVAPVELGDYFSWGTTSSGRDIITTIEGYYYYLLPGAAPPTEWTQIPECGDLGAPLRPLLSKAGDRITTFHDGSIVVRDLNGCAHIFDTHIRGAKADFSFDGRYIAFHAKGPKDQNAQIDVIDLENRRLIQVTRLSGSCYYPSWTRDGSLAFRYESPEFRGFVMASGFLANPSVPLTAADIREPESRHDLDVRWENVFSDRVPSLDTAIVLIWASWNSHSPDALRSAAEVNERFRYLHLNARVLAAADRASVPDVAARMFRPYIGNLSRVNLLAEGVRLTGAHNQMPTYLLFRRGVLVDRWLGARNTTELWGWSHQRHPEVTHE